MNIENLKQLINRGECINVEFKESKNKINKDAYETVCSFLNRSGGHLILGVNNSGEILGVNPDEAESLKKNFVTSINNPDILNPTFYLSINEFQIDDKVILYVFIPESSSTSLQREDF